MTGAGCGLDGGGPWLGVRDVLDGCGGLRACVSVVALLRVSALVCTVCLSSRMSCPGLRFVGYLGSESRAVTRPIEVALPKAPEPE